MTTTMVWFPLFLTLLSHCTGNWMQGQGQVLWEDMWSLLPSLVSRLHHHHLCVSPPCNVLGLVCADSAILRVWGPGTDSHQLLHWKQLQHWVLCSELVPTATRHTPQNCHLS